MTIHPKAANESKTMFVFSADGKLLEGMTVPVGCGVCSVEKGVGGMAKGTMGDYGKGKLDRLRCDRMPYIRFLVELEVQNSTVLTQSSLVRIHRRRSATGDSPWFPHALPPINIIRWEDARSWEIFPWPLPFRVYVPAPGVPTARD